MSNVDNEGKVNQTFRDKDEKASDLENSGKVNQPFESEEDEHAEGGTASTVE